MTDSFEKQPELPETVVGSTLKVDGDLNSQGDLRIDGEVHGSIHTEGSIIIGTEAKIFANITATNAEISGQVEGDLNIKNKTSLTETARVRGKIKTAELSISSGALFCGESVMDMPDSELPEPQNKKSQKKSIKLAKPRLKEPSVV